MTSQFPTLFRWHVLRYALRHKLLGLLNVLSIALGTAVYLAIQIANHSANESFSAGVDLVAGKAHLEVRGDIDEKLLPVVARTAGVKAATPIVEGVATLPEFPGEYLRLVGVDIFTSAPFATARIGSDEARLDLEKWLGRAGSIAITTEFANRHRLKVGVPLRAQINAKAHTLEIVALMDTRDSPAAAQPRFATIDIGWAQELFGTQGRLSAIQILLEQPARATEVAEALRAALPANLEVAAPRQRSLQMQTMLSAFRLNLTALSLVSLLVGAFLIYNTISASVVRRRAELGMLRALGATRGDIRALFLGEAMIFGLIGVLLGAIGGIALAEVTIRAVEQTVSSLYLLVSIDARFLSPWQFAAAAGFGIATVIAGAWVPANEAAHIQPVAALSAGAHSQLVPGRRRRWLAIALAAFALMIATGWLSLSAGPALLAFASAFFALAGFAALAPDVTRIGAALFARGWLRGATLWRLAADRLGRSAHRNAVTVAALATALAMTIGLTIMIFSFRQTVERWVGQTVVADLYVAPSSNETVGLGAIVPEPVIAWLRAQPEVASVDTFREVPVTVAAAAGHRPALLAVIEGKYRRNLEFGTRDDEAVVQRLLRGEAVVVSESFARKFRLRAGDSLPLLTANGPVSFSIAGVYRDYTRDQGIILITRELFTRHWTDRGPQSLAIYVQPDASPDALAERFLAKFGGRGEFSVYSNRTLRQRIMGIFDQTFAVTQVLRVIALIVAVLGIALSVTTLVAERQRETGMLRAVGASTHQVRSLFTVEAVMIALIASLLGIPAGVVLASILTWVVNPAFFGWTIHFSLPWLTVLATPLWIIPAAILAAWWPARRAARANLAEAVREE